MSLLLESPEGRAALQMVSRDVIALTEPDETDLVPELVDEFVAAQQGKKPGAVRDDALGFGFAELVVPLTPLAASMAVKLGEWLMARLGGAGTAVGAAADEWTKKKVLSILGKKEPPPTFTREQLTAIRDELLALQPRSGVQVEKARLMADALVGRLSLKGS